jgi:tRNA 2-selenouridine synthase
MADAIKVNIEFFLNHRDNAPLVDVRSPAEYAHAHIPEAINIPLFNNEERAIVGTLYKKSGKETSILKGLEIVGPKLASFVKKARDLAPGKKIFIHCWRGGMRSESMAWLFETSGIQSTIIEGGYKAYRQYLKNAFDQPAIFLILGGMTGSGKTYILRNLKMLGEQVIDLEGLANHKGSAFGGIAQDQQPSTEQFENNLFEEWNKLNFKKPVWLEDESKAIGKVHIPDEIFTKMRESKVIELKRSKAQRVEILKNDYATLDPEELKQSVLRISKRLGGLKTREIIEAIEHKNFGEAIGMVLDYYDKTYVKGLESRNPFTVFPVYLQDNDLKENAKTVQQFVQHEFILS